MTRARQWRGSALLLAALVCGCKDGAEAPAGTVADNASDFAYFRYEALRDAGNWTSAAEAGAEYRDKYPQGTFAKEVARTLPEVQAKAEALLEANRLETLWTYQAVPAGKGTQRTASIDNRVPRVEEGEFAQPADAQLILRDHPDWGRSAYLVLHETKFHCGSPCTMEIAFDDAAATRWSGKQADTGHGPALFVNDDVRFGAALAKAQVVRVTLPPDSGRIKTLAFDVGGFRAERYAKP